MRRLSLQSSSLLLMILTLAPTLTIAQGQIDFVDGEVWIESGGERTRADFGSQVETGDFVITGNDGVAVVSVNAGTQIKLRENSRVEIAPGGNSEAVGLRSGGLFARVNRAVERTTRFEVQTPTLVAGVRGTEFFVAFGRTIEDLPDVWLCVNEGAVEVAVPRSGSTTLVEAGEGINVLSGTRATDPRFYPWTTRLNWNFDPEAGEVRDTTDLDAAYSDLLDQDYD